MEKLSPCAIPRSSCVQKDETFHRFLRVVGDFGAPYGLQLPGEEWRTVKKKISDPVLESHLTQQCWVGKKGSWYPDIFTLDFDHPKAGALEQAQERLQLADGMLLPMTSPSFARKGNFHVALKLEKNGFPVTLHQGYTFLQKTVGDLCEIYPQKNRAIRLPFGRDQFLLGKDGGPLKALSLAENLHWLDKLDPVALEGYALPAPPPPAEYPAPPVPSRTRLRLPSRVEAQRLLDHGLQAHGTCHYSQYVLAVLFARMNYPPEAAKLEIRRWIRHKHNQFSQTVRTGKWRVIAAEIKRQVDWVWGKPLFFPDQTHNLQGYLTRADLDWIVQTFPGDVVNQKRLFALACYYRPRVYHEWVYIPAHVWRNQIANDRTYKGFIADLEAKGLLRSNWSYRHHADPKQSFSRSFKLQLPATTDYALAVDGRNLQEYYETLRHLFPSIRERVAHTEVSFQNFYNHEKKDVVLSLEEALAQV